MWRTKQSRNVDPFFYSLLLELESACGFTLVIETGYSKHPEDSPHALGLAADIRCTDGWHRMVIVREAMKLDICRIGVYDRHIHVDIASGKFPQHVIWHGVSTNG